MVKLRARNASQKTNHSFSYPGLLGVGRDDVASESFLIGQQLEAMGEELVVRRHLAQLEMRLLGFPNEQQ